MFYQLVVLAVTLIHGTYGLIACEKCSCTDTRVNCNGLSLTSIPSKIPPNTTRLNLSTVQTLNNAYCNQWDLNVNKISNLTGDIFDKLTSLEELDLGVNEISSLSSGIFDNLTSLKKLKLLINQISTLPGGIFDELTSLENLELYSNQISTLPSGIFDKLTSLQELYLQNNKISTLPGGIFDKLTSLQELYLHRNQIATLPGGIFDKLTLLQELDLDPNPFLCCEVKGIIQRTNSTLKNAVLGYCKFQSDKFRLKNFDISKCPQSGKPKRCKGSRK